MKKTVLAVALSIAATSTFAADNYFSIGLGKGEYANSIKDSAALDGFNVKENKPVVLDIQWTRHFFDLGSKAKAGFSLGGHYSLSKGELRHRYMNMNYVMGTGTVYFAPTVSFKPVEEANLYAKLGPQLTVAQITSEYSTKYKSGKTSESNSGVGYIYGLGANYNIYKKLVIGAEYNLISTNIKGSNLQESAVFLNIGFKK